METENPNGRPYPTDLATSTTPPQSSAPASDAELLKRFAARLDRDRAEAGSIIRIGTPTFHHLEVEESQRMLRRLATVTPETELARYRAGEARARDERLREEERRKDAEELAIREGKVASWKAFIKQRGDRYAECNFRNFEIACPAQEAVVEALRDYSANIAERIAAGVNVLLLGPAGTGKDHLMTAVAHAAVNKCGRAMLDDGFTGGFSVQWSNGAALFAEVRSTFDIKGRREDQIVDRLNNASVLYLSDLIPPGGKLTDFQSVFVYEVVDERYNRRKPTWLTLNVASRADMESGLGSAIVDRLIDGALILQCAWPSYRKKLATPQPLRLVG